MTRKEILDKAAECVCGKRATDYGTPENSFDAMADMMTAYMAQAHPSMADALKSDPITAKDAAMTLAILKIVRIATGNTPDSFADLAGYAACAGDLATETEETKASREYLDRMNPTVVDNLRFEYEARVGRAPTPVELFELADKTYHILDREKGKQNNTRTMADVEAGMHAAERRLYAQVE